MAIGQPSEANILATLKTNMSLLKLHEEEDAP
jgi:hypothetical protein